MKSFRQIAYNLGLWWEQAFGIAGAVDTAGQPQPVGCSAPVKASGTLTFGANATSTDPFVIGPVTYRVMTTPAQAYDVKLGATAAITLDNIKAAVNASGTPGTEYFAGTLANPAVEATTNTDTTQLFVARVAGAAGNSIATTETFTDGSNVFGAATLTGGLNSVLTVDVSNSSSAPDYVILSPNTSTTAATWAQATKTVAASGTPERLAAATTLCETVLLEGKNARGTNNTGNVWVGTTSGNDTQLLMIAPGSAWELSAPSGKKLDLNLIYVDVATNADGITYTAFN